MNWTSENLSFGPRENADTQKKNQIRQKVIANEFYHTCTKHGYLKMYSIETHIKLVSNIKSRYDSTRSQTALKFHVFNLNTDASSVPFETHVEYENR